VVAVSLVAVSQVEAVAVVVEAFPVEVVAQVAVASPEAEDFPVEALAAVVAADVVKPFKD
jgi:hypothetical protein